MHIKSLDQISRNALEQLLLAIPFYKAVKQQDAWQFEVLLEYSRVVNYVPGEVVLAQGERGTWLYFLLKGKLAVYAGEITEGAEVVNYITPGEVFGDLAMLVERGRTATVVADFGCKQVMVFGTDFEVFGELQDMRRVSLQTKLAYYRNMVHNLRWKLEEYRMKYPHHTFAERHRQVRLYTGPKNTLDELLGLDEQARALARLLLDWNGEFVNLIPPGGTREPSQQLVAAFE